MWKPVVGYEGLYEVSDSGVVRSVERELRFKRLGVDVVKIAKQFELKQQLNHKGYFKVRLYIGCGDWKQWFVHRLVAIAFIDNPKGLSQVNHKDGDKTNNSMSNLEWITNDDNMRHAYETGVRVNPSGEKHPGSKISSEQVLLAVKLRADGLTFNATAKKVGCSLETVQRICSGRSWSTVTGIQRTVRNKKAARRELNDIHESIAALSKAAVNS